MERYEKNLSSMSSGGRKPNEILGLLMNVDYFQPYKDISYSVSVIYAARNIRYNEENVIIGIIPGHKEPKKHINSHL